MTIPQEFLTIESLKTFPVMVAATFLIVQFFKPYIKKLFTWIATKTRPVNEPDSELEPSKLTIRGFAWMTAMILQMFVLLVAKILTLESIGLAVINSFLIALTAIGAHHVSKTE